VFLIFRDSLIVWCGLIAVTDLVWRRVPNSLIVVGGLAQAVILIYFGYGLSGLSWFQALLGLIIGLMVLLPFYYFRIMGAGDVKLFAILGFFLGPKILFGLWLAASILAGVHALMIYISRGLMKVQPLFIILISRVGSLGWYRVLESQRAGRIGMPYAAYLAVSAIVALLMN
jgi:prepilin peptidase CpaA